MVERECHDDARWCENFSRPRRWPPPSCRAARPRSPPASRRLTDRAVLQPPADRIGLRPRTPLSKDIKGQGQTIVIVDAFGSPTIASDLSTFDKTFHLSAPPSFKVITPAGAIAPYRPDATDRAGWPLRRLSMSNGLTSWRPKPHCSWWRHRRGGRGHRGFPDIVKAENYVIAHKLGKIISQSFDASEVSFSSLSQITPLRSAYIAAANAGVSVLAGSGDWGSTNYLSDASTLNTSPHHWVARLRPSRHRRWRHVARPRRHRGSGDA